MNPSTTALSIVIELSVTNRTLLRAVLAELSDRSAGEIVLRKGRITKREARVELELRTRREQLASAFVILCHPRITLHSYSVGEPAPAASSRTRSEAVGIPTLPSASSPRLRAVALAH